MRNLGASVGVAALVALLDRNIQINRSGLAEHLSVFNPLWRLGYVPIENGLPVDRSRIISHLMPFGGAWPFGSVPTDDPSKLIGMWGEELNRQAATIAYLNDFRVLAIMNLQDLTKASHNYRPEGTDQARRHGDETHRVGRRGRGEIRP